jgi:putative spermidine/putrescine transport system permease protein
MARETAERIAGPLGRLLLRSYIGGAVLFLLGPIVAITAGSLTTTQYVVFPPKGITFEWYLRMFDRPEMLDSFVLSLGIGATAATIATILGLAVSSAMVRYPSPLNHLLWLLVVSPMMLPSVVLGFAFLQAYTHMGFGTTAAGLLAGHVVLVTPYAVALILTGLRSLDPTLELAARSLGATPSQALRKVTLPLILWSMVAGWGLAFLVSFGDAAVSVFLNTPEMVTLPVRIFDALRYSPLNPELTAISSGLVIVTLVVLVGSASVIRFERLVGAAGVIEKPGRPPKGT